MVRAALSAALLALALVQNTASEFVEVDVVALDRQAFAVTDLTPADFRIRDSGVVVPIQTFTSISARGVLDEERSVVLLMDDIGVSSAATSPMRQIGRLLLSPMQRADEVSVLRLSREHDDAFGDAQSALERIEQYHGGAVPYSPQDTSEALLRTIVRIAEQLEAVEHRRKVVVCLGPTSVCNLPEPVASSTDTYHKLWFAAMSDAARSNVSVYEIDPTGVSQFSRVSGTGLIHLTGGDIIRNSNDFSAAAARIWREASRYYLLGYWAPPSSPGHMRQVEVTTTRRDVHLQTRRFR
jgi:VWFA-related protein